MAERGLRVGTSGWSYAHWAKGVFYPRGMKSGEWLAFFSRNFTKVEVNSTFYRLPRPETTARWREVTGEGFRFAVKLWRRITHVKRLVDCSREIADFLEVANGLGEKRGPLLVQLPPSLRMDAERLDAFLEDLGRAIGSGPWTVAVEFRDPEWLHRETHEVLNRHGAALCLADMPRCPIIEPNDVSFVYVRRHGPGGRYRGRYSAAHVADDARRIRGWLRDGKEVWVYYNNDIEGHALENARQLLAAVG